jgi:hypothetical protein
MMRILKFGEICLCFKNSMGLGVGWQKGLNTGVWAQGLALAT